MTNWITENYIEVFGAITGIIYVILEIRQTIWLWPLGILTSGAYVWIFFSGKLYADMSLQAYYVIISVLGWFWWVRGEGHKAQSAGPRVQVEEQSDEPEQSTPLLQGSGARQSQIPTEAPGAQGKTEGLPVTRIKLSLATLLFAIFIVLYAVMFFILSRLTDSPVPEWDSFLTSLSIIATWMLARKIYEHWYLWIVVNTLSVGLYFWRGLYPTVVLYAIYGAMSFIGLKAWKKTIMENNTSS